MKFLLLFCLISISCNPTKKADETNNLVPKSTEFKPLSQLPQLLLGQTVYVPIYSSIYFGSETKLLHLTAVLSIRNTSLKEPIIITQIDYFDTNGKLIKSFITNPFTLGQMASKDFVVPEMDLKGGTGANFLVTWHGENKVSRPIIESVMLGEVGTKGISFTSRGEEVESH
ncbi:MAG: DUF3124 domain-containing protein [Bacteriovoracaceae bacterium]